MISNNASDTLNEIGIKHNTDKSSLSHGFLDFYEKNLHTIRNEKLSILEIGIYNGGSLKMWEEYFHNSSIVGLDINPECAQYAGDRREVYIGDQSDIDLLTDISRKHGPFDLIIDDGSHIWDHQIASFQYLFPQLKNGGIYIMEDINTSYGSFREEYCGASEISAVDYLKKILDYVIADSLLDVTQQSDAFIKTYVKKIEFISFFKRTSIIKKLPQASL